jgi:hypothetical protein
LNAKTGTTKVSGWDAEEKGGRSEMAKKFYKTTVQFTVLSEEPIPPHVDLQYIGTECVDGQYVGSFGAIEEVELSGGRMAFELCEAGSEPGFFDLDDEGNPAEDVPCYEQSE